MSDAFIINYQLRGMDAPEQVVVSAAARLNVEDYHGISTEDEIRAAPQVWFARVLFEELHIEQDFADQVPGATPAAELKAERIARQAAFTKWRRRLLVLDYDGDDEGKAQDGGE